jgi:hypothetical protein
MHQNFEEIQFVEGAIWVGDHFCSHPAKLAWLHSLQPFLAGACRGPLITNACKACLINSRPVTITDVASKTLLVPFDEARFHHGDWVHINKGVYASDLAYIWNAGAYSDIVTITTVPHISLNQSVMGK